MAWRGVHITKPARLALADRQLAVAQEDGDVRLALEDIAWVVLDNPQVSLTGALLAALAEAGIALIVSDARHTPSGLYLPFHRHHRQAGIAAAQAGMSLPLKKRLWQKIVRTKIENQAAVLAAAGRAGGEALAAMAKLVGSGDPDNVEARAARDYWGKLFADFRREDAGDKRNALLNYGYAVMRAAVARALVAAGLLPCFGLGHESQTNAFNLADDMQEPFRPFIDRLAFERLGAARPSTEELTLEDRQAMAGILLKEAKIGGETMTLLTASEAVAASLVRAIEGGTPSALILPEVAT